MQVFNLGIIWYRCILTCLARAAKCENACLKEGRRRRVLSPRRSMSVIQLVPTSETQLQIKQLKPLLLYPNQPWWLCNDEIRGICAKQKIKTLNEE